MAFEIFLQQAIKYHNQGLLDEAENLYQKALALSSENASVLNLLGLVAQSKGLDNLAVDYFYRALKGDPYSQEYNFSLAYSLDNLGRYNEAIVCYQKSSSVKEALNNIANIYKKMGNIDEAISYYKKALLLDGDYEEPKINLAFLSLDVKALKTFNNFLADYYLALICFENKDCDGALKYLSNIKDDFDYVYSLRGEVYFYLKEFDKAKDCFEKSLSLNAINLKALLFLADFFALEKEYDRALALYNKLLEYYPDNLDVKINYANTLFAMGNKVQSLEEYRKIIIINPNIAEVSNNLGILLKEAEEFEEALGLFFNALNLKPELDEISVNLLETLVLYADVNKDDAHKIAKNWFKNYPKNVYAKHLLARFEGKGCDDVEFNKKIFDAFSDNYEEVLEKIGYNLPQKIKEIFGDIEGRVLDLGCGSGLLGTLIKNNKNHLLGVDLSQEMIRKAEVKNVYDELKVASINDIITQNTEFDYIFALDVFCYIADLSSVINFLKNQKFLFSVEKGEDKDFELQINGRYKHNQKYVEKLLAGVDYKFQEIVLRQEKGVDVIGIIYYKD